MQENIINNKLRAARELNLDITEEYKKIDGNDFVVLNIKKDEKIIETFANPLNKIKAKKQLLAQQKDLQNALKDIELKIEQIDKL